MTVAIAVLINNSAKKKPDKGNPTVSSYLLQEIYKENTGTKKK